MNNIYDDEEQERQKRSNQTNFEKGGMEQEQAEALKRHQEIQEALNAERSENNEKIIVTDAPDYIVERDYHLVNNQEAVSMPPDLARYKEFTEARNNREEIAQETRNPYQELQPDKHDQLNERQQEPESGQEAADREPDEITRSFDEFNETKRQNESAENYRNLIEGGDSSSTSSNVQTPDEIQAAKLERARARLERLSEEQDAGNDNREMGEKARERSRSWE